MRYLLVNVAVLSLLGCAPEAPSEQPAPQPAAAAQPSPAPSPAPAVDGPVIVAFGDSLTAGYGVSSGHSYPDYLQQELLERGLRYRVVNEGVSGDTTSMALQRIDFALAEQPRFVVLALGGNDGLRGLPADAMEANLQQMVERFQEAGATVVLAGMTLPPNFGAAYIRQFEQAFPRVAERTGAKLIPFLLDGVAADRALNQDDGIHPTAEGNRIVARTVADFLAPLLEPVPGK